MKTQVSLLAAHSLALGAVQALDASHCADLAGRLNFRPDIKVHETAFVAAETNLSFPNTHPTCDIAHQVATVDLCRVSLLTTTGPTSNISMEAWLPTDWSGRFLGVGNGGLNGCIKYNDINYGASHGFATIGTNNGHDGTSGEPFLNNPGVIEDYVYRSIHLEAEIGKEIARIFYGKEHTKSYYLGCSTGGRQGFKEAQEFPDDFDGIVAGAPAFNLISLLYWTGQIYVSTGPATSPSYLSPDQWDLVYKDVFRQCDRLDGLEDGILEDTDLCQYRPENLICKPDQTGECLTGEQAKAVRDIYSPVYGSEGQLIYPRFQPGANATEGMFNGQPHDYPTDWFRYVVYNDTEFDPATLNPADYDVAAKQNPFNVATWKGDLSAAQSRGTKILHYHGLEDNAISSDSSQRYYNHVSTTMNLPSAELDDFYRYFRISGMAHCRGGLGANMIGGNEETFASFDPEANVLAAMVRWVEEGIAPDYILGTKLTEEGDVDLQRRHCKYPKRNVYAGHGDPKLAESWECV